MSEIHIFNKLYIDVDGFGAYDWNIVHYLLANTFLRTVRFSGVDEDKLPFVLIKYRERKVENKDSNDPLCSNEDGRRVIRLTTKENYWCQWIYQFAHESCHHIISGPMIGLISGQVWFEETICEVNSMFQLVQAALLDCNQSPYLQLYIPAVRDYLDGLLQSNPDLVRQFQSNGGVWQWLPLLSEQKYHRAHYNAIASQLLPLFVENPCLWKICSHIGDSRQYQTLQDLLEHLTQTADESYADSLQKMINCLLP